MHSEPLALKGAAGKRLDTLKPADCGRIRKTATPLKHQSRTKQTKNARPLSRYPAFLRYWYPKQSVKKP